MTTSPISGVSNYAPKTPILPIEGFNREKSQQPNLKNIFEAASNVIMPKKMPNQVQPAFSASAQDALFNGFNDAPKGANFTALA